MIPGSDLLTIAVMATVTYSMRVGGYFLLRNRSLSARAEVPYRSQYASPELAAELQSGAIAFAERLADGRFDTGVDSQDAACDEVPVSVQIVPASRTGSAARTASSILPEWTDLGF